MTNGINYLLAEIDWLEKVIDQVIRSYLLQEGHENRWQDIPLPEFSEYGPYPSFLEKWNITMYERLAIALAIVPHVKPEVLDIFFGKNKIYDRGFTEFGGHIDSNHSGFLPTVKTLHFLIAATQPELYYEVMSLISNENTLRKEQILAISETESNIPSINGVLSINERWLHYFLTGEMPALEQNPSFPAKKITTKLEWDDMVLDPVTMDQVLEILTWLHHGSVLMDDWGLNRILKPGYRALFYGPPGTGKTLAATLLGKASGREVYKVDVSMIVSKYIGETEKNLAGLFDMAQSKDWVLFFDEADALFGRRTETSSAHDHYDKERTSYLLQRIEDYPGVVIFSFNLKANMDEAFTRRFQAIIHFSIPGPEDRYQLWRNAFSGICKLSEEIDLLQIAETYELTGESILNVLHYCALAAIKRDNTVVLAHELIQGIRREFQKENKTI